MHYQHTQKSYMMAGVTLAVLILFVWMHMMSSAEPQSVDSGTNLAVTTAMVCIVLVIASFVSLHVGIDEKYVWIKFGMGIFQKKFLLDDIVSATAVRNHWWYGWGIRVWFWPKMWIYNVSGLDAVEIKLKNGKTYRIGTDEPKQLEAKILQAIG